jgi:hypothetical protein
MPGREKGPASHQRNGKGFKDKYGNKKPVEL